MRIVCLQTLNADINAIFRPFTLENRGLRRVKKAFHEEALGILSQNFPRVNEASSEL
jgi:hypothetical protein